MISSYALQVAALATVAVSLVPQGTQEQAEEVEIFSSPVKVEIEDSALPLLALEDVFFEAHDPIAEQTWKTLERTDGESLSAGSEVGKVFRGDKDSPVVQVEEPKIKQVTRKRKRTRAKILPEKKVIKVQPEDLQVSRGMRARLDRIYDADEIVQSLQEIRKPAVSVKSYAAHLIEQEYGNEKSLPEDLVSSPDQDVVLDVQFVGSIEISQGLAFVGGQDEIRVFREFFGEVREIGEVDVLKGQYEIALDSTEGSLVGVLYDSQGKAKGEASFLLSKISTEDVVKGKVESVHLKLKPVVHGARAKVLSSYSFDEIEFSVEDAVVSISGKNHFLSREDQKDFVDENLSYGSTFQIKAKAKDHWGTSIVSSSGVESRIELFADKKIQALLDHARRSKKEHLDLGIVFGKVSAKNETLAHVEVEMAGFDEEPIYFNSLMIPDSEMEATGSNGFFAFVGVPPGVHQVRARQGNHLFPAEVFSANPQEVSYLRIEKGEAGWVPLRVHDPMREEETLASQIHVVGEDDVAEVDGTVLFEMQQSDSLIWIESAPQGDYLATRMAQSRRKEHVSIPGVSIDWLEGFKEEIGIAPEKKQTIVGYINGPEELETYQVFLGDDASSTNHRIVYFNERGEVVEAPEKGGGFTIFDVDPGMQTVVIVPNAPFKTAMHLVVADADLVSVVQHQY